MTLAQTFKENFAALPLVAILRGVSPDEVVAVAEELARAGWRLVEVPLNSPNPLLSIRRLADHFAGRMLVGAGTVLNAGQVGAVADAGGQLIVSPNQNAAVIRETKSRGLISLPGVHTASECFAALDAGADGLKLFPAESVLPAAVKALRAVLPVPTSVLAVGGISLNNMQEYLAAGCNGFGIGGSLYRPGASAAEVAVVAKQFAERCRSLTR